MNFKSKAVVQLLNRIQVGTLYLKTPDQKILKFEGKNEPCKIIADLQLKDWQVFSRVLERGDVGFGECFIEGLWNSDDISNLLTFVVLNKESLDSVIHGNRFFLFFRAIANYFRFNSKINAKKNIEFHYDISNDFYRAWLDSSMTYSSGLFKSHDESCSSVTLDQAQRNKLDRAIEIIQPLPNGSDVCEIGFGWGSLAYTIIEKTSWNYHGITLSNKQYEYVSEEISKRSERKSTVELKDYRDINKKFDAILSIEMFEAVGEAYWVGFFHCLFNNLKEGGKVLIQTILISDEKFDHYRNRIDYIQTYIFPGGMLASPKVFRSLAKNVGFEIIDELFFGKDYAETLARWSKNFSESNDEICKMGFNEKFRRQWKFYLEYCKAGFNSEEITVAQYVFKKNS